jgi:hypothetical protein
MPIEREYRWQTPLASGECSCPPYRDLSMDPRFREDDGLENSKIEYVREDDRLEVSQIRYVCEDDGF